MSSESEFFDALGGEASTGFDTEGREVGLSILAFPDGSVSVTLGLDLAPGDMRFIGVQISPGLAIEWGMILQAVGRAA